MSINFSGYRSDPGPRVLDSTLYALYFSSTELRKYWRLYDPHVGLWLLSRLDSTFKT